MKKLLPQNRLQNNVRVMLNLCLTVYTLIGTTLWIVQFFMNVYEEFSLSIYMYTFPLRNLFQKRYK